VNSNGAGVTINVEAAGLSAEDEVSKDLAVAAYARLRGDTKGVGMALDTLIAHQPAILEAQVEKADLLADGGDYAEALALYQQALATFQAANPKAAEPLTLFTRKIDAVSAKIAGAGSVTSVAPGSTDPVFVPDSIVDAYGSRLANTTLLASGSLSTALGGTTVTITDSKGTSVLAPLFYVSPAQVNYAAPGISRARPGDGDGEVRRWLNAQRSGDHCRCAASRFHVQHGRSGGRQHCAGHGLRAGCGEHLCRGRSGQRRGCARGRFERPGLRGLLRHRNSPRAREPGDGFHRRRQCAGSLFRHARFLHRTRSGERAAAGVAGGPRGCAGHPQRSGKDCQSGADDIQVGAWFNATRQGGSSRADHLPKGCNWKPRSRSQ